MSPRCHKYITKMTLEQGAPKRKKSFNFNLVIPAAHGIVRESRWGIRGS